MFSHSLFPLSSAVVVEQSPGIVVCDWTRPGGGNRHATLLFYHTSFSFLSFYLFSLVSSAIASTIVLICLPLVRLRSFAGTVCFWTRNLLLTSLIVCHREECTNTGVCKEKRKCLRGCPLRTVPLPLAHGRRCGSVFPFAGKSESTAARWQYSTPKL